MNFTRRRRAVAGRTANGFIIGMLVGSAAAALLISFATPAFKRRLRKAAMSSYDTISDGVHGAADAADSLTDQVGALLDSGKERVRFEGARVASAVEAARDAYAHAPAR